MKNFATKGAWPVAAAALVALLAGCEGSGGPVDPWSPPPGSSAVFRDAYVQGCWTGYVDAGRDGYADLFRKDAARYQIDADYRNGWDQGHAICYLDEKKHPKIHGEGGAHP